MQPLNKNKSKKVQRYSCSNPNCNKVFSKPKIIKYYVCPSCQTLVNLNGTSQPLPREKPVLEIKKVAKRRQKGRKQDKKPEPKTIDLTTRQSATASNELPSLEEPEVKEKFETIKPAQEEKEEPTTVDTVSNQQSEITVEKQTPQSSGFQCPHYFGYLSKRSKGEVIPEICFECPKSIECMLSIYNKSKEDMEEIKKWYPF